MRRDKATVPITLDRTRCGIAGGVGPADSKLCLRELGVGWLRMPLTWAEADTSEKRARVADWVQNLRVRVPGIKLLVTFRVGQPPYDLASYRETLSALVAVDADAWQVENEWEGGPRWWDGSVADYARLLDVAVPVIRGAGKLALVGGLTSDSTRAAWLAATGKAVLPPDQATRAQEIGSLLRTSDYDAADLHIYHELSTVADRVKWFAGLTGGRPVWVTECGGPDARVTPYSDAAQAEDLPQRMAAILKTAQRAFWLSLYETTQQGETYDHLGLIRADGTRKPAYDAYRKAMA